MQNWLKLLFAICFIVINAQTKAQNERFHGGAGDGFGVSLSPLFNMADVGYALRVEIDFAQGQEALTNSEPIKFLVTFNNPPVGFNETDLIIEGTALSSVVSVEGAGTVFTVALSGFSSDGTVSVRIPPGTVQDADGNSNIASVNINNKVTLDTQEPEVEITFGSFQQSITNSGPVVFRASFNETVTELLAEDVQVSGSANPTSIDVEGNDTLYNISVDGMLQDGSVSIVIPAGRVSDLAGNLNLSSINTENQVYYDITKPDVEIDLAEGQANPSYSLPLRFKVMFSEDVMDFTEQSVSYGGSVDLSLEVNGSGSEYTVLVGGALPDETVSVYIDQGVVHDLVGNSNTSSVNTNNSIKYIGVTGIEDISGYLGVKVYYSAGNIVVSFQEPLKEQISVDIFNPLGQIISRTLINDKLNYLPVKKQDIYFIRLFNGETVYQTKVFAD